MAQILNHLEVLEALGTERWSGDDGEYAAMHVHDHFDHRVLEILALFVQSVECQISLHSVGRKQTAEVLEHGGGLPVRVSMARRL